MTSHERYLKALEDPASGITVDTPAHLIEGTVQHSFAEAIKNSDKIGKIMSLSDQKALIRRNSSVRASQLAAQVKTSSST